MQASQSCMAGVANNLESSKAEVAFIGSESAMAGS